jgi:hypothetical protein
MQQVANASQRASAEGATIEKYTTQQDRREQKKHACGTVQ